MQTRAEQFDSLRRRLDASDLLEGVTLSPDHDDGCRADVSLSTAGHELAATAGLETVLAALRSAASDKVTAIDWRFSIGGTDPWPDGIRSAEHVLPRICSWLKLDNENEQRFLIEVEHNLTWLDGHFPGRPILAGVVQLHWAILLAKNVFGIAMFPREIVRLKFQRPVLPPALLELKLQRVDEGNVQFHYRSPGHTHSQGRVLFAMEAP